MKSIYLSTVQRCKFILSDDKFAMDDDDVLDDASEAIFICGPTKSF